MAVEAVAVSDPTLLADIKRVGGFDPNGCYQCGTCTVSCDIMSDVVHFPRRTIRYALLGLRQPLRQSVGPWICHDCGDCSRLCPQDAKPNQMMTALRRYLTTQYDWTGLSRLTYRSAAWEIGILLLVAAFVGLMFTLPRNFGFGLLSRSGPQALSTVMLDKFAPVGIVHRADTVMALLLSFFLLTNAARMFWFLTAGKDIPARLYFTELWHLVFQGATQSRWRQCKTNVRNWLRHLFLVTGYVTIFLLVVLFLPWFQVQDRTFRWTSILGYYSTAAVLVTTVWIIIERAREKPESHLSDWLFPILLCLTAASGILVNVLRLNNLPMATYVAYMIHLMIAVPMLVIEVPFGKWTHLVYRPLALYVLAVRDRAYQLTSAADATSAAEAVPHAI
jgi:quinone-modifying oxidoreductase, subunit QmoC